MLLTVFSDSFPGQETKVLNNVSHKIFKKENAIPGEINLNLIKTVNRKYNNIGSCPWAEYPRHQAHNSWICQFKPFKLKPSPFYSLTVLDAVAEAGCI